MSKTFWPLFKVSLKQTFNFRNQKHNTSMKAMLIVFCVGGLLLSALYSFIFVMAALESQTEIINVLYAMAGFASLLALTTTVTKVKSTLFGGNDYDMLAALPIPKREILLVKFFSLYLIEFLYAVIFLLPCTIICFINDSNINYLIHFILMIVLVPILPLLLACLVGTFISLISDRSKFGNLITMLFYAVFLVLIMISSSLMGSGEVGNMIPLFNIMKWMNPTNLLLSIKIPVVNYLVYVGANLAILAIVIIVLARFYDYMHILLTSSYSNNKYIQKEAKINTSFKALLKNDIKRYFGSKGYLMNTISGGIISVVMIGLMIFIFAREGAEFLNELKAIFPYLSLMIMWCIGITTPAASAISMEGKNIWIIKTLPIDYKKYLKSKIILSEIVLAPFVLIASILLLVFSEINVGAIISIVVLPQLYLLGMTYISLVINTKHYRLDWSNEMEVAKNGTSIWMVMLIDFAYTIIISASLIVLGIFVNILVAAIVASVISLIIVIIARNNLYKKCPKRLASMEI